jgi:calcineurin B family protein 1
MYEIRTCYRLSSYLGFTGKQVQRLYSRFKQLDKRDCGFLIREDLLCIPEVNINPLGERLINVIMEDYGENNQINFKQFMFLLARFRQGKIKSSVTEFNTRNRKLRFLFDVCNHQKFYQEKRCLFI